ncbi:ATP-binding protein [Cytobacillus pseudoceanisediminis]|nr:ATP-binding protein [Cytobacillus pseudoceanisediminis]UQX55000.1 ATP-binding protein [Cytobacillus pseudoceanisediminis]
MKQIIELHTGEIRAVSQAGKGTTLTITFFREKHREE